MQMRIAYSLRLLWIILLWTSVYDTSFCVDMFPVLLGVCGYIPRHGIAGAYSYSLLNHVRS